MAPDFDELRDLLYQAAKKTFGAVQDQKPTERFYAFGLYHEPLWGYIIATCNTEEGLTRRAEEYKLDKYNLGYSKQPIEELRRDLRWNPADWDYHDTGNEEFRPVNDWLLEHNIYSLYQDDWTAHDQMNTELIAICRGVLHKLDDEKVFGDGEAREDIVLNIMMGDQDRSWIEHAKVLNPPSIYERWINELDRTCTEWRKRLDRH
jgi:hypothetical protein